MRLGNLTKWEYSAVFQSANRSSEAVNQLEYASLSGTCNYLADSLDCPVSQLFLGPLPQFITQFYIFGLSVLFPMTPIGTQYSPLTTLDPVAAQS